jgi:hypothetical protein
VPVGRRASDFVQVAWCLAGGQALATESKNLPRNVSDRSRAKQPVADQEVVADVSRNWGPVFALIKPALDILRADIELAQTNYLAGMRVSIRSNRTTAGPLPGSHPVVTTNPPTR